MSKIGYMRVSTLDQNLERQEKALYEQGVEHLFSEKLSGKNTERPQLKKMLDFVREGDVLYIESISRLARSTKDLLNIVETLTSKGVGLVSLKEKIDTNTPQGRFVLTLFGALAELERESILERQREGLAIARQKGAKFGRPAAKTPEEFEAIVKRWKNGEILAVEAIKLLGMSKPTFYRKVKEWEAKNNE